LSLLLLAVLLAGCIIAQTVAQSAPTSKTPAKAATKKAPAKSTAKSAPPKRYVQQQPTPQRYKEIQQALADRGFFEGTVDGNWGPSSIDALKRFQRDQNLEDDGKIGSLSLIRLGLGPERAAFAPAPSSAPAPQEPTR